MITRINPVATVTLDSNGNGFCSITCPSGVSWEVELVSVSTTTASTPGQLQCLATLYSATAPNAGQFLENTFFGNGDVSDSRYTLMGGESLCAQWTGGQPGAIATLRIRAMQSEG